MKKRNKRSFIMLFPLIVPVGGIAYLIYLVYGLLRPFFSPTGMIKPFGILALLNLLPFALKRLSKIIWPSLYGLGSVWQFWQLIFILFLIFYSLFGHGLYLILTISKFVAKEQKAYLALGLAALVVLATTMTLFYGQRKANNILATPYEIRLKGNVEKEKEYKIAFISDLHLGYIHGQKSMATMVKTVNAQKPDLILVGGDILHSEIEPFLEQELHLEWQNFQAPLGIYAVDGNHDAYSQKTDLLFELLEQSGVIDARDQSYVIDESFVLVGRQDKGGMRGGTRLERTDLDTLLKNMPAALPVILIDHQPTRLEETTSDSRINVLLSGHTHRGQFWPITFFTDLIYEVNYGLKEIAQTKVLVTSGIGTWGPDFRLGSISEVAIISLIITPS